MINVTILVPPFASLEFPSLDASVARQLLSDRGCNVDIQYLNQLFGRLIGRDAYTRIANIPPTRGVADYIGHISHKMFPASTVARRRYYSFRDYLSDVLSAEDSDIIFYKEVRAVWAGYVTDIVKTTNIVESDYIFFVCRHQQLGATLTLIDSLKDLGYKGKVILFGQHLCSSTQAYAIKQACERIDGVIYGGTATIEKFFDDVMALRTVPGVFAALNHLPGTKKIPKDIRAGNMAATPDYADFYERYFDDPIQSVIPFQGSQGCWWADKSHCIFCGLIEENQQYSAKISSDAYYEILQLVSKYECLSVVAADHLLSNEHADQLIELLSGSDVDVNLFFEIRATTSKKLLQKLLTARVFTVEIGIESFDSQTLKYIRKGTTPLINIRVLKWAQEIGLNVYWTLLYGFDCETFNSMQVQNSLLRSIRHLQPPLHATPVRLERNSPMFKNPGQYGIKEYWPAEAALHTYPYELNVVRDIVKFFDYDCDRHSHDNHHVAELQNIIEDWQKQWVSDQLYYLNGKSFVKICDSRDGIRTITLRGWRMELFLDFDEIQETDVIINKYNDKESIPCDSVADFIRELNDMKLLYCDGSKAISVVPRANNLRLHLLKHSSTAVRTLSGGGA